MTTVWSLASDGGEWAVGKDSRQVYHGTYEECENYVISRRTPKDTVIRIEEDGYRWDLTRELR
jgi:hypothetical protein